ncbi:MAG: hypothetical protein N2C12_08045, partial [Planctomycetales bacterium]
MGVTRWAGMLPGTIAVTRVSRGVMAANANLNCGRSQGPLLVMTAGQQVVSVDTLKARLKGRGSPVLWFHPLTTSSQFTRSMAINARRHSAQPWADSSPNQSRRVEIPSRLGPITEGGITFIRNRDLVSVDLLNGLTLWLRKGFPRDAVLFGDEQYVFAASPHQHEAQVVSAFDGSLLGSRKLPPPSTRWTMRGRHILSWRTASDSDRLELAYYDAWTEQDLWVHPLDAGSKGQLVGEDAVAVMQRDGRFLVIDLATGDMLVDQYLKKEPKLKGIYVIRSDDTYLLVANRGATYDQGSKQIHPMPQQHGSAFVTGNVYAIDRAT